MNNPVQIEPPKWSRRLLVKLYGEDIVEDLVGDLEEIFFHEIETKNYSVAKWNYNRHVLSLIFSYGIKRRRRLQKSKYPESNHFIMHKSYFTIAFRTLKKHKLFSAIRLANLVIGIAVSMLCWIYVRYELSYEKSFPDSENIYRLQHQTPDKVWVAVPRAAGVYVYENMPDVISMVRFSPSSTLVTLGEKTFMEENILFCDSTVFDVFQYEFISGNPDKALVDPLSAVLTKSSALKYFGTTDILGKQLVFEFDRGEPRVITGVINDPPSNSHIQFDFLNSIYAESPEYNRSWSNWGTYAYLHMKPNSNLEAIAPQIEAEYRKQYEVDENIFFKVLFMPLEKIHLYSNAEKELSVNANINYLYIFSIAGLFVLVISVLNFINLTLATSMDRGKEIGLRKSIGASRKSLVLQLMVESYMQVLLSLIVGIGFVYIMLPFFRNLSGLPLPFAITEITIIFPIVLLAVFIGLICGLYPAMVISRFKPAEILKAGYGTKGPKSVETRKILSVVQFAISAVLIIGAIIIYRQSQFIKYRDLGFEKDQILTADLNYSMNLKLDVFENELKRIPGVLEVSHSSSIPGYRIMREGVRDISSDLVPTVRLLLASESLVETLDLEILDGRSFTKNLNQEKGEWILNEEAVKEYQDGNDIEMLGRQLSWGGDTAEVVGIVKNFNFETLHEEVSALAIYRQPRSMRFLSIRFNPEKTAEVLSGIKVKYDEVYPNLPDAEFEFLNDHFASLYNAENKLQSLVFIFCIISLIMTISGIFGLTIHFTQKKTKEIAIRKILGSSIREVVMLILKHFMVMVAVSLVISIPLSYFLSNWWLTQFAYKIDPGVITFVIGGFGIILIVLASSFYTTLKTAYTNPVRWLRNE